MIDSIVYRYLPADAAIKTLESSMLKVSKYSKFNDPFELAWRATKPSILNVHDLLEERLNNKDFMEYAMKQTGKTKLEIIHLVRTNPTIRGQLLSSHDASVESVLKKRFELADGVGRVICFSSSDIDPRKEILMWSHYAESHKGIRLGFILKKRNSVNLNQITYSDTRPPVEMYDPDQIKLNEAIRKSLDIKSSAWSYEKEVRMVVSAGLCKVVDMGLGEAGEFIDFDEDELVSVTTGMNYCLPYGDVKKAASRYSHAALLRASMHPDDYQLIYSDLR